MGDKRIYELTKIDSAPGNGVLPIDVPGSEETNGITVDNLAKTMPVATSDRNGLLPSTSFLRVNEKQFELKPGQIYEIGISGYKVLMISNGNSGDTAIVALGYFNSQIIGQDSTFSNSDKSGKICVFKNGDTYIIKNNFADIRIVIFTVL